MSLGPFIYTSRDLPKTRLIYCKSGVSSAKISLDLTEIDHLYECARASWTRRDLIKTRLFLFRITVPYLLIF